MTNHNNNANYHCIPSQQQKTPTMRSSLDALSSLLFILSILLVSCADQCKDVTCLNDGVCNDGQCDCLRGYSGSDCSTVNRCLANNVQCENGGYCENGSCTCPDGFFGDDCTLQCDNGIVVNGVCECNEGYSGNTCGFLARDPMIGRYTANDNCIPGGSSNSYQFSVDSNALSIHNINIVGLWDGMITAPIVGTVAGTQITITTQTPPGSSYTISGSGTYDNNRLTLNYNLTNNSTGDSYSCTTNTVRG